MILLCLTDALFSDMSIIPSDRAVSVQFRPVALFPRTNSVSACRWGEGSSKVSYTYIPRRRSIKGVGDVVKAFSMAAQVQHFVLHMSVIALVQMGDFFSKTFPLRFFLVFGIGVVSAFD